MAKENADLMEKAREALKGKWGLAIGTFLLYTFIMGSFGAMRRVGLVSLLVAGPMELGAAIFSLSIARGKQARLEQLFDGFRFFTNALVTYLLTILYVFLWLLLLIVPGIIAALSYAMVFYILADNPTLKPDDVLERSKQMMDGYKLKLFYMFFRFFLLALLCVLTLGIGFLWFIPYVNITMAEFYEDIKDEPTHLNSQLI